MPVALLAPEVYQAELQQRFAQLAGALQLALPQARIEPIGASAIPGAWSKGDLDLCVLVAPEAFGATLEALQALGYAAKTDTLQADALRMLLPQANPDDHALQLVAAGSLYERLFLGFRDLLRANPVLTQGYNAVKQAAAQLDDASYRQHKATFIREVLSRHPDTADIGPRLDEAEVLQAEMAVWAALQAGDAKADRDLLAPDFLGVYADGLGDREAHAAPLEAGPRVAAFRLLSPCFLHLGPGCILISYEAIWERFGSSGQSEHMRISSVWQQQADGGWLNRFSQDTAAAP